ncbi:hypothetical protein ACFOEK_03885 [Litoribrevibacter euphylliae]|uniref:YD repeat-containing protein n=1 Tax=Litoribrevibacter euphylliae TaxID=1834034 RepID=A0ABV7HDF3_9GAMM
MNKKLLLTAFISSFLAACGDSSSSNSKSAEPNNDGSASGGTSTAGELVGQISNISGLAYTAGDYTGVVNANGEFNYDEGDTVTFSLGGIELGQVAAAESLSLADLFPNLPETAASFRKAMRDGYFGRIYAQSHIEPESTAFTYGVESDLHKTSNLMKLLLAMDEDGDSSNGLDLLSSDWNTQLTNMSSEDLPLNTPLYDFSTNQKVKEFQQNYAVSLAMDVADPLAYLYSITGKSIEVNPVTQSVSTEDTNKITNFEFNDHYQLSKIENVDTSDQETDIQTWVYDSQGNIIEYRTQTDTNGDGSPENNSEKIYAYNTFGALTQYDFRRYTANNGDTPTDDRTEVYGQLEDKLFTTNTLLTNNLLPNDPIDQYRRTYDADLNMTSWISERVDSTTDTVIRNHLAYELNYHEDGRLESLQEYSYNSSGAISSTREISVEHTGNQVTVIVERFDGNGDFVEREQLIETSDNNGRIVSKEFLEANSNNETDSISTFDYTYDDSGRIIACDLEVDTDGNGSIDSISRQRHIYNDVGIAELIYEEDADTNGEFERQDTFQFTYGESGELLEEPLEKKESFNYTDTPAENGVRYLISEHKTIDLRVFNQNDICTVH